MKKRTDFCGNHLRCRRSRFGHERSRKQQNMQLSVVNKQMELRSTDFCEEIIEVSSR